MPGLADLLFMRMGGQQGSLAQLGGQPQNLNQNKLRRGPFGPALFASMAQQSPAMQEWANPEQMAQSQGVEQAYAGQDSMRRQTRETAAMMGLGRGFTSQADMAAQQAAMNEVSGALLASRLLGTERRAMLEQMLMDALSGGNQAAMLKHAQHRAGQASPMENFAMLGGGIGDLLGGAGALISGFKAG